MKQSLLGSDNVTYIRTSVFSYIEEFIVTKLKTTNSRWKDVIILYLLEREWESVDWINLVRYNEER